MLPCLRCVALRCAASQCAPGLTPFKDSRAGNKWMQLFLKRNPEVVKWNTEVISKARAAVTKEKIRKWFTELDLYLINNLIL